MCDGCSHTPSATRPVRVGLTPYRGAESALELNLVAALRTLVLSAWADPGWWGGIFRADVARLVAMPAGPDLMAELARLEQGGQCPIEHDDGLPDTPAAGSVSGFPCLCQLAIAAAWQACLGYAQANANKSIVAVAGADVVELPREGSRPPIIDPAKEELALALRLSPGSAGTRIETAREVEAVPELAALAEEGVLPERFTSRISHSLASLSSDDARSVARRVAQRARDRIARGRRPWTGSDAAAYARRLTVACGSYTEARKKAEAGRRVQSWSNGDGTAVLQATLPEACVLQIMRRLTACSHPLDGDDRPIDARRADLLTDLLLGRRESGANGVEVNVVISAESLLGLTDTPATIPGYGPIPADVARDLAADGRWRAWVTDASGAVTATGTRNYRPTESLARLVRAREPHCRMAGCRFQATRCDLDHAVPFPAGSTTAQNLGPLCRRHHILKTHLSWRLDASDPGQQTWRSPAGVTVTDRPEPAIAS